MNTALQIINFIYGNGGSLLADNNQLKIFSPKGLINNELKECLRNHKQNILNALGYHKTTKTQLKQYAGEDWSMYENNELLLIVFADLLYERKLIAQGIVPNSFDTATTCACCGDVYVPHSIANNGYVLGCPWCENRIYNLPIPEATSHEHA